MRTGILVGGIILFILGIIIAMGSQEVVTYSSEECSNCGGHGSFGIWPLEVECTECDGSGMVDSQSYEMAGFGMMIGGAIALLGFILIIAGVVMSTQQVQPPPQPYIQQIYPPQPHSQQPDSAYTQHPGSQPLPLVTPQPPVQTPVSPSQQPSQEISPPPKLFCENCGKRIEGDPKFCNECGESIGVESTPSYESSLTPPVVEMIFRCSRCDTPAILTEGRFWCNACSIYCTDDFRYRYPTEVENIKVGMPSEIPPPGLLEKWGQSISNVLMILLILFLIAVGLSIAAYLL